MKLNKFKYFTAIMLTLIVINLLGCKNVKINQVNNKSESMRPETLDDIPPNIIDNIAPDAEQKIKSEAKNFHVSNLNGEEVYLYQYIGKPIVINFWASWNEGCIEELSYFANAENKYKDSIKFLMINLTDGNKETIESANKFLKDNNINIIPLFDDHLEARMSYNVTELPRTIFIDKYGYIQKSVKGTMTEEYLDELIEKIKE